MRKPTPCKTMLAVAVALCILPRPGALCHAADWSLSSSISATETYDSNVRFRANDEQADFVTSIQPAATLRGQTEQTLLRLKLGVTGEKYVDQSELDGIYSNDNLDLNHKWSGEHETDLNGYFIRDSTLEDELLESGIRSVKADRNRYGVGVTQIWTPWEVLSLSLGGDYGEVDYPGGENANSNSWGLSFEPKWSPTERDVIGANIYYQDQDYSDNSAIRNAGGLLYWQRRFDETTVFSLGAGYRMTWTEYTVGGWAILWTGSGYRLQYIEEEMDGSDDGLLFLATVDKQWSEKFDTSLSFKRDQYSSVDAQSYERNQAAAHFRYKMSDITTLDCDLNYNMNTLSRSDNANSDDIDYVCFTPSITRQLTEDLYIRLAGSYAHQTDDYDSGSDITTERYKTWITLTYSWPRLWENH